MRIEKVLSSLGDGNAENERNFDRVFVETSDYRSAADGSRNLILGGRGAGKSAIFRTLSERPNAPSTVRPKELVVRLEADSSAWRVFERAAGVAKDDIPSISRQWELAILLHCFEVSMANLPKEAKRRNLIRGLNSEIDKLLDRDLLRESPHGRMSMVFSAAADILRRLPFKFKVEAPFVPISIELKDEKEPAADPSSEDERRGVVLIESMYGVLGSLLESKARVHILIDQLDEDWKGRPHQVATLCGLLSAVMRVTSVLTRRHLDDLITFSVFLRSDLYEYLKKNGLDDASKYRRRESHLRWSQATLRTLVDKRVMVASNDKLTDYKSLFADERVAGKRLDEYLLALAVPRPRDVIQLFSMCLENAHLRNGDNISRDDVLQAESTYSSWRRDVIQEESRAGFDVIESLLESLTGGRHVYSPRELTRHLEAVKRDYDIRVTKPKIIDALVDFGVIGVRAGRNRPGRFIWDVPPGQRLNPERSESEDSDVWVLHPSLYRVLNIRPATARNSSSATGARALTHGDASRD